MYEQKPLLPFRLFVRRLIWHTLVAITCVSVALLIGIFGYHFLAGYAWIDSLLNASMILTGMGQVGELKGITAKLWASAYALFSGLIFITSIGIAATPLVHR